MVPKLGHNHIVQKYEAQGFVKIDHTLNLVINNLGCLLLRLLEEIKLVSISI